MRKYLEKLAVVACVYALQYARNLVLWRNQGLINVAAEMMLGFLANAKIQFRYKNLVGAALAYLVQKDSNNIIASAFLPNTTDMLKAAINQPSNEINL